MGPVVEKLAAEIVNLACFLALTLCSACFRLSDSPVIFNKYVRAVLLTWLFPDCLAL